MDCSVFDNHREKINKIFGLSKDDDTLMTLAELRIIHLTQEISGL